VGILTFADIIPTVRAVRTYKHIDIRRETLRRSCSDFCFFLFRKTQRHLLSYMYLTFIFDYFLKIRYTQWLC
jgi:hypothetical protein